MRFTSLIGLVGILIGGAAAGQGQQSFSKGQRLEDLAWPEAERILTPDAVVVLPLGAASTEHGPHLKLRTDLTIAEHLTRRVLDSASVVVAPTLTYHHYPAFLEYPGSTSLSLNTARDMTADVVRTLARYGARRFYVLNVGMSTTRALTPAAASLANDGILLRFTDFEARVAAAARAVSQQEGGIHADEIETSMMLFIDAPSVDMTKAVKDFTPTSSSGRFTRQRGVAGTYSVTGISGDPTLATREKGRAAVEGLVAGILDDIRELRGASLPDRRTTPPPTAARITPDPIPVVASSAAATCTPGDQRTIRSLGDAFTHAWNNRDAESLGRLWSPTGDLIHPSGVVEQGSEAITQNRRWLFSMREYRTSRHPMEITMIRCLAPDIAVADGKWQLLNVLDKAGTSVPPMSGVVTLIVKKTENWLIEAYRYTITPPSESSASPQKRPGVVIR
jgi:creatinine amidohydrolase